MTNIIQLKNHTLRDTIINKKMELFEVKQMAEMEHGFKMQCQVALKAYKHWQNQHKNETDGVEIYYGQLRGHCLKTTGSGRCTGVLGCPTGFSLGFSPLPTGAPALQAAWH